MNMRIAFRSLATSALGAAFALLAPAAHAQTFSNAAAISVPTSASDGRGTLYPSPIVVSGAPASIGYVSVTLNGFSHTFVQDVNVLLVSPSGQKIFLMANTNGAGDAVNDTLSFIPDGTATLPNFSVNVVSGFYAPSVYSPQDLPAPAPAGPYGTALAPLIGTNANGTWNLYVWDDLSGFDNGAFTGGWSIGFNVAPALPVTTAMTYQGVLAASGAPITGNANIRFTLCNSATFPTSLAGVAPPITRNLTGIADGLVSTTLDFGEVIDTSQALWLNIEVESPPVSGFVTLSPRQPITPTPQARVAKRAVLADIATNAATVASGGFAVGSLIGPGVVAGANQHDVLNRGVKSRVGYATVPTGLTEFAGMITSVVPGTNVSGNSADVTFHTWEANTSFSREIMRINGSGNVGIGTTTPTSKLSVVGAADISGRLGIGTTEPANKLSVVGNADLSGNLGIGTDTPTSKLSVVGAADISGRLGIGTTEPANKLSVIGNVDLSGNVGIGTTTPVGRLDVTSGALGPNNWPLVINNSTIPGSRGGARLNNQGFFEMTNDAATASPNFARLNNTGAWSAVSDARMKTDVTSADGNLDAALKLRPVNFRWKRDGTEDFGLIAQEVRAVLPKLVTGDESKDSLTLNYSQLSVVAIGAIQEQQREIGRLTRENADLKTRLERLEKAFETKPEGK